jgi:ribonuclease P protein component
VANQQPGSARTAEAFPRAARILRTAEFTLVLRDGRRAAGRCLVVHVLEGGREASRLGVTVSRKVGGAVVRNRIRRRLREIFRRSLRPSLDQEGVAADVVFRVLPAAAATSFAELEQDAILTLARARRRQARGRPAGPAHPPVDA